MKIQNDDVFFCNQKNELDIEMDSDPIDKSGRFVQLIVLNYRIKMSNNVNEYLMSFFSFHLLIHSTN